MRAIIMVGLVILLSAFSCKKESEDIVTLKRDQTQCADPWGYGVNNQETISKLQDYLVKKNIVVTNITLSDTKPQAMCLACTCTNGFVFSLEAGDEYREALNEEGFK